MTYKEFLAELFARGIINEYGVVTSNCSITYVNENSLSEYACQVRVLAYEPDPLEGDAMIIYLDRDVELAFHADSFKSSNFNVCVDDQLISL